MLPFLQEYNENFLFRNITKHQFDTVLYFFTFEDGSFTYK